MKTKPAENSQPILADVFDPTRQQNGVTSRKYRKSGTTMMPAPAPTASPHGPRHDARGSFGVIYTRRFERVQEMGVKVHVERLTGVYKNMTIGR
ncbi:hypothetical protein ACFCWG_05755 [Streptomyces sp. NPDC056390]|uniref:hypothetical protein n=1 Tax=Streptomyces sp. NPDC056390 TaxID=3345806 RepID=UPI0035DC7782